ncbi:Mu transposase C-terminal domain-containing protein [Paenibacillus sp. FSL L8-0644]|uniref:Mu transposase C-terminal domain-containing protein n=1 Tax=Paenibacillus sp. FSL L8-0644 TaxID=2954523 RepID=UPI0030FA5486
MLNEIYVNTVLALWKGEQGEDEDLEKPILYRVLWIQRYEDLVIMINTSEEKGEAPSPEMFSYSMIQEELKAGNIEKTIISIPRIYLSDQELSSKDKQIRDQRWSYLNLIASKEHLPEVFFKHKRSSLISDLHNQKGISKTLIWRILRRYWQRGMIENALLPDYDRCGGKGKERLNTQKKLGRPSMQSQLDEDLKGINVTDEIKHIFRVSIARWFHKREKRTFQEVYELMLARFFNDGFELVEGKQVPILKPSHERPTLRQFKYFYQKENNTKDMIINREGSRRYNIRYRAVEGNLKHRNFGPGSAYQIDSTVADIYVVSRFNRKWVIGRPIIYIVSDAFSSLIAGIYVGFEGPSWVGAMLALENAASNKVEYCERFGIELAEDEWPAIGLPEVLTTDRGTEYTSQYPKHLKRTLNVELEALPPFRPDWKPVVEKTFDLIQGLAIKWTPGAVLEREKERGETDYRSKAILDIHEFEMILIECVRYHNKRYLPSYERSPAMVEDELKPTPVNLWQWGIRKGLGSLRWVTKEELRMNLLPSKKGRFTRDGIRFAGHVYTCATAEQKSWRFRAKNKEVIEVEYSYDPRDTSIIFLRHEGGSFEECYRLSDQYESTKVNSFYRYEEELDKMAYEEQLSRMGQDENIQNRIILRAKNAAIVEEAKQKTGQAIKGMNQTARLKNMREKQWQEKERERQTNNWTIGQDQPSKVKSNVVPFHLDVNPQENRLQQTKADLLRKILEEDEES